MPIIKQKKIEPYSAQQMYELVNDVPAYPAFLPWCKSSRVISSNEQEMVAAIENAKGPLNKWFETRNQLSKNEKIILNLRSGPFKKLQGFWKFCELDDNSCEIYFEIDFEFGFGPLALIAEPIFHSISTSMVEAFSKRARVVYG